MTNLRRVATFDTPPLRVHRRIRRVAFLVCGLGLSTAALFWTASRMLPNADGDIGFDYSYFFPYLLAGAQWIRNNGWFSIPYFTPDFCGGMPWLANPQSIFYSLPQVLTLISADPIFAVKWSLFVYATVGGAATYFLLRRCFGLSWQAAGLGFVLFQLNGFLIFRIGVGHLPYHTYGLIPLLCLCPLVGGAAHRSVSAWGQLVNDATAVLAAAFLFAIIIYGGALNYVIPGALSVVAIIFLHQAGTGFRWRPWLIFASACVWAIFLSALKLVPSYFFVSAYPRPYLSHFLFHNPLRLARSLFESLFIPEIQPFFTVMNYTDNSQLGLHELEFGVSVVPFFLIIAGLFAVYRSGRPPRYPLAWMGFVAIMTVPIFGTLGDATWGQVLLHIPIINNNTFLTRWWSVYILSLIVLAAIAFDRVVPSTRARDVFFAICVIIVVTQLTHRDLKFYTTTITAMWPLYDPAPVRTATRRVVANTDTLPAITELGPASGNNGSLTGISAPGNNGLLTGISALPCYEPIFGYSLEMFPARDLVTGPVAAPSTGLINMADPRCYLAAGPNGCRPGNQFQPNERANATAFASRLVLSWREPGWQIVARITTVISFSLSIVFIIFFCLVRTFRAWRRGKGI